MAQIYSSILEAVGHTPFVRLNRLVDPTRDAEILVKAEMLNPGGSVKIRPALNMIEEAERQGLIQPDTIIVEPTSGNQGISLSLIAAVKGYRVIICMPENMSKERQMLIRSYGAEIILTPAGKDIEEAIRNAKNKAEELAAQNPKVFLPQQFANPNNPKAHYRTGLEIVEALQGQPVDAFVSGFGTGGTLSGIGRALREAYPGVKIVCAEPDQAAVLMGKPMGQHMQQGIGDGFIPPNLDCKLIDQIVEVTDEQAICVAKRLAREEGLFVGISSGTNVHVAMQLARTLGPGKRVVTILPDAGCRYLSTGCFDC